MFSGLCQSKQSNVLIAEMFICLCFYIVDLYGVLHCFAQGDRTEFIFNNFESTVFKCKIHEKKDNYNMIDAYYNTPCSGNNYF